MPLSSVIAEAAREGGNPVPVGLLRKGLGHPGISLRSAAAVFSYHGPPERALRLTARELEAAGAFWARAQTGMALERCLVAFQRAFCYHTAYLYGLCRALKPDVVVETGVYFGASSAFILQALADNGQGRLFSVDLPAGSQWGPAPGGGPPPGSTVPHALRGRWTLVVGDARSELPPLLDRVGPIDLFHHDSEHTRAHMEFEFEAAFSALRPGGLLVSDDVLWNDSFRRFCARKGIDGKVVAGIGLARKPATPKT